MAKGPEARPAKNGCPVTLRKQFYLQVSILDNISIEATEQEEYIRGVSYIGTWSFSAVQATPTTSRIYFRVRVSK
jgi:hypothetical protein